MRILTAALLTGCFSGTEKSTSEPDLDTTPTCEISSESITIEDELDEFSWSSWISSLSLTDGREIGGRVLASTPAGEDTCLQWWLEIDIESAQLLDATLIEPEDTDVATIYIECTDQLSLQARLSLYSPDGLVDEQLDLTLLFDLDSEASLENNFVHFQESIAVEDWDSGIHANSEDLEGSYSSQYNVTGQFNQGFEGSISVFTETTDGEVIQTAQTTMLQWAGDCSLEE